MIKSITFGTPLVFASGGNPTRYYSNTYNGTFSYNKPISIMVNHGEPICENSCHYAWGFPESVLWIKKDGSHGVSRVQSWKQIKGWQNIVTAIGGVGISNHYPELEGFSDFKAINIWNKRTEHKDFSDVLRRTEHSVVGFKDDLFFASIMYGTSKEIQVECLKQGFTNCVQLDGGSWASCNTENYKHNLDKSQFSLVQVIDVVEPVDKPVETVDKPDRKWRYFTYQEFANTKDHNANKTKDELIDKLDELRHLIGRSITITSGYRTPKFNTLVGGDRNSEHIYGLAADLRFNFTGYSKESIARICKYLGFTNVGVYWNHGVGSTINRLHLGIRDDSNGKVRVMDWHASGKYIGKTYI